jgi:hypothetical protein
MIMGSIAYSNCTIFSVETWRTSDKLAGEQVKVGKMGNGLLTASRGRVKKEGAAGKGAESL